MKTTFFTILITLYIYGDAFSQDIIMKKNGDEIKAKIIEVASVEIKYKKFDNLEGPQYSIAKYDVFMIKYENGTKDVFNEPVKPPDANSTVNNDKEEDKIAKYYVQKKKTAPAILYSFIPFAGPFVAQRYVKKNIGRGILLGVGELLSMVLSISGYHKTYFSDPVYSQRYNYYTGRYETYISSYDFRTVETYDAKYYIGWAGFWGIPIISAYFSANDVKVYNKNLYNKIYNDSNTGLGFQIVPTNKGIFAKLVYKF